MDDILGDNGDVIEEDGAREDAQPHGLGRGSSRIDGGPFTHSHWRKGSITLTQATGQVVWGLTINHGKVCLTKPIITQPITLSLDVGASINGSCVKANNDLHVKL